MDIGDRISELYKGEIFTEEAQSVARQRIQWMCDRTQGRKVADVGCSQGIVSILLARDGLEVVGVDTNAKAIEYAESDRAKELPEVQQRLRFVTVSVYDVDLPEHGFDTVIMGEFLEHLARPQEAINRAYALLSDAGRLIITTPFGLLRALDHKQTFYVASLYRMIDPYFTISESEIIGKYLCLCCRRREEVLSDSAHSIDLSLVEQAEREFLNRETGLTAERDARKQESAEYRAERNTARAELSSASKETSRVKSELAEERRTLQQIRNSLPYQLGNALVRPVRKPGLFALRVAYRVAARSPNWVKGIILKATSKSKMLTALQTAAGRTALPDATHRSKPRGAAAAKAHVLDEVRNRIMQIKQEIEPVSTHDAEPRRKDLSIAVIMDEFTYECFRYEASLITLTPDNWMQVSSENRPEFLFVESAWLGNESSWRYQIVNLREKPRSQLPALVQWYKDQGIPTVFWNKEDPAHYHEFLDAAKLFDYVFTTDADCIEAYKKDLAHDKVFGLPFAVQPRIHNPIGSGRKIRDVAFAGSWYEGDAEYRQHRKEQMAYILEPALQRDVDIYDRHYRQNEQRFRFPDQYQRHILGQLPYDEMVYAYKMYRVFLNVSSVSNSSTMLPRRVLEILASGTCVMSGESKAIANLVGSDIVPMSSSPLETASLLKDLLEDSEAPMHLAVRGLRKVMGEHTCEERLDFVMRTIGIDKHSVSRKRGVSIIACTNKLDYMKNIFANYNRQQNVNRELIIILNSNSLDVDEWVQAAREHQNASVYRVDEKEGLGTCLNLGIDKARFDCIAKFDDDDYYGPAYLEDLMNAMDYSRADLVGKCAHYMYLEKNGTLALRFPQREHCFVTKVAGGTLVMNRKVFEQVRFDSQKGPGSDTRFQQECISKGFRIYSADRFNFVAVRKAASKGHTWQISDDALLSSGEVICYTKGYVQHVTC